MKYVATIIRVDGDAWHTPALETMDDAVDAVVFMKNTVLQMAIAEGGGMGLVPPKEVEAEFEYYISEVYGDYVDLYASQLIGNSDCIKGLTIS